jgi:hypothetical protein
VAHPGDSVTNEQKSVDAVVTEETIQRLREDMAAQSDEWVPAERQWHYEATRDTMEICSSALAELLGADAVTRGADATRRFLASAEPEGR